MMLQSPDRGDQNTVRSPVPCVDVAQIERARGEAESNRLRVASVTPQLLELKRLENERARIEKWNGDVPRMVVGEKSGFLMQLPADVAH